MKKLFQCCLIIGRYGGNLNGIYKHLCTFYTNLLEKFCKASEMISSDKNHRRESVL